MFRSLQLMHAVLCMVLCIDAHGNANYLRRARVKSMSPTSTGHVYGSDGGWVHFSFSLVPTWCDQPPVGALKLAPQQHPCAHHDEPVYSCPTHLTLRNMQGMRVALHAPGNLGSSSSCNTKSACTASSFLTVDHTTYTYL
jgi:hypothetical protein